jgi:hypothetical protein
MRSGSSRGKGSVILGNILLVLPALLLIVTSAFAFTHSPQIVQQMGEFGLTGAKISLVASLELASGLLLLIPFTRSVGVLMVSAYLGGAMATHLEHEQAAWIPAITLAIIWTGAWLRHPEAFWSFRGR